MAVTIRETILAYPGLDNCEEYLDKVVLPSRGIDGMCESVTADPKTMRLVAADCYAMIGGLPDFTENKLSETYPRKWYQATARRLYRENGEPEKADRIGGEIDVPRGNAVNRW